MKTILQKTRALSLIVAACLLSGSLLAADVNVAPGFNTLPDAVNANPGSTFILERGGVYITDVDIVVDVPTVFKAGDGSMDLAPPVVQYFTNPGENWEKKMFLVGADCTFEGIGFQGWTPGEELLQKATINCSAADITLIIDGCVFQGNRQALDFGGAGNGNTYILKNNIFFNMVNDGWDNWGGFGALWGGNNVDYQCYNNTYFMSGRVFNAGGSGPLGKEMMDHNTYVNTWGDTFYPTALQHVQVTNNLLYNAQMRGYIGLRTNPAGDTIWEGDFRDWTVNGDTLVGDVAIFAHEYDSLDNDNPRTVKLTHNVKMYDQTVLDFYAENEVSIMTFWNAYGRNYYGPRYGWEFADNYLQEDGNEIDPEFAMDLPAGTYEYAFLTRKERHLPADQQGENFPYSINWLNGAGVADFIWPLPFNFKPENKELWHLGSDGYPIGDLNWFGSEVVAAWENGDPNPLPTGIKELNSNQLKLKNYPNPFGSSTMISYELPAEGMVSLKVFSVSGALVSEVVNEYQISGQHEVSFDAGDLSAGVYFCKVQMGSYSQVAKISVMK